MNKRIFVVPGPFVPYNDTVTLLTYKRLRNINADIDVFALKTKEDQSLKEELIRDIEYKKFHTIYSVDYDYAVPRNYPLRLPISFIYAKKYIKDALKEFEKKDYQYLYTSIAPGISHIAGNRIKKKYPNVKWYASFSDPFKGSPYKKVDLKAKGIIYKIMYKVGGFFLYNDIFEKVAIQNADKLIFICEEQRDFTLKQYSNYEELKKKSIIMPLTYIPEWNMYSELVDIKTKKNTPMQAVHLGRLYGNRRIDTFLEALKELKEEDNTIINRIVFHQYSEIQSYDVERIKKYNIEDLFVIHDKVSYKESLEIMKNADILVLFDTILPQNAIQPYLPSKIVEYLLLKKPILGICGNNSPSYRILKKYGFDTLGYSKEEIKNNIKKVLKTCKIDYQLDELNNDNYSLMIK